MKKQTAVEWLVEQLYKEGHFKTSVSFPDVAQLECVAKAMEKEQIMDAWICGNRNTDERGNASERYAISDESFYNETYGGDK